MAGTITEPVSLALPPVVRRPLRASLAKCAVMLVIFLAGGVAGYSLGTAQWLKVDDPVVAVSQQPDKFTEYLLAQLKKDLVLTDEQFPQVQKIIIKNHEGFERIRRQSQPLFEKQMGELEREMQSVLTPTQWTRYKSQLDWMRNRHRGSRNGGMSGGSRSPGKDGFRGNSAKRDSDSGTGPGRDGKPSTRPDVERKSNGSGGPQPPTAKTKE